MEESSKVPSVLDKLLPHKDQLILGKIQSFYAGIGKPSWKEYEYDIQRFDGQVPAEYAAAALNPLAEMSAADDFLEYYSQLRAEAIAGDGEALNDLGWYWLNGFEMAADPLLARQLFIMAAAQECSLALFNLGEQAYFGRGIAVDAPQAEDYYQQALENGVPWAGVSLGRMYDTEGSDDEHDFPYDHGKAVAYYKQGIELRDYEAGFYYARLALDRESSQYNVIEGLYWMQWAALKGVVTASEALALYYHNVLVFTSIDGPTQLLYCFWRDFAIQQGGYWEETSIDVDIKEAKSCLPLYP